MSTNGLPPEPPAANGSSEQHRQAEPPAVVRRLEGASAAVLGDLVETFEELQTVLRCCERLVTEVAGRPQPDEVVVEGLWTMALFSYARSFSVRGEGPILSEADLTDAQPETDVLKWHQVLLEIRDQHADPVTSPRERFTIAVTQEADGTASGVAVTSTRQPLVDELTVRQTGAIAYALSEVVNKRIEAHQLVVFEELKGASVAELEKLETIDLAPAST